MTNQVLKLMKTYRSSIWR